MQSLDKNRQYHREYYQLHADRYKLNGKRWRQNNVEHMRKYEKQYREKKSDIIKAIKDREYKKHKEAYLSRSKQRHNKMKDVESYKQGRTQYGKQYYSENKDTIRVKNKNYTLKKQYGLSREQYEQMLIAQNNRCAVCENTFSSGKGTHVDHNHKTNQVRQLLCNKCNQALGLFNDDALLLSKALAYLTKWN